MTDGAVTGAAAIWLRVEGLAALVLSAFLFGRTGVSWWWFAGLLLVPDISMVGYLANARLGAACYNAVHSYLLPLALASAALASGKAAMLPFLLIWTAHIGMDRAAGYGLKYPSGFRITHLGKL